MAVESASFFKVASSGNHSADHWPEQGLQPVTKGGGFSLVNAWAKSVAKSADAAATRVRATIDYQTCSTSELGSNYSMVNVNSELPIAIATYCLPLLL